MNRRHDASLLSLISLLTLFFFIVDVQIELGVAVGVMYITVILLAAGLPYPRFIILFAIICSILIIGKYIFAPLTGDFWKILANRLISLYAVWATAIISLYRKESERRLEEAVAELDAANRYLASFNQAVSHDLRNPLLIIEGLADRLARKYGGILDEKGKKLLEGIASGCGKANKLVIDLLDFSRATSTEIEKEKIAMDLLAKNSFAELIGGAAGAENIRFTVERMPPAFGDRAMVRLVIVNLLSNAIKFTKKKKDRVIEVGGFSEEKENVYFVKDNGAGFDMSASDRLFRHFQRLHDASQFEGTGLGLIIVKTIVEKHGGRVWAEGRVDDGAKFFFTLPKERQG